MTTTMARPATSSISAPSVGDVRTALRASLGDADFAVVWPAACASARVSVDAGHVDADSFDALLTAIGTHGRLARVLAMSWRIRCTAQRKVATLGR